VAVVVLAVGAAAGQRDAFSLEIAQKIVVDELPTMVAVQTQQRERQRYPQGADRLGDRRFSSPIAYLRA
jgi:hypothetical protein